MNQDKGILPDTRNNLPECHFCNGNGREKGIYPEFCPKCQGWGRRDRKPAKEGNISEASVLYIESGKPRTAHLEVSKLLSVLTGHIRICDPYYGMGSLLRLDEITNSNQIQFLTQTPDSKEKNLLSKAIGEFIHEKPEFEFRRDDSRDLHDRFILSSEELILLGHGLKDLGKKDSFVVRLDQSLAGDVIESVRLAFDQRWQNGTTLP